MQNDDDEENRVGNRPGPNVILDEETVHEEVSKVLSGCFFQRQSLRVFLVFGKWGQMYVANYLLTANR
jgi:hypothetical protein